ncbi:MAG TPA: GGDEF domain-containing protein [Aquamicrobium sp.]|nr:GGDEF domain-containing protein [Aquamicrobium sp.]
MPKLDFLTLYIVIFLISLTMSVVWAGFAYTYRPHRAVLHWMAATILSLVGGIVLAFQGNEGALVPAVLGNVIILVGFSQFWIGLRRFRDLEGGQGWVAAITLVAALCMIALHDSDRGRAIVYAAGQATVMAMCIVHLLRHRLPGIGAFIAMAAFAVAMLGQLIVIASNGAVMAGLLDYTVYYGLASYALLCTVFSGTVWNLGFALMAIDKLYQRLVRLSETDELTGLANRRAFQKSLARARDRSMDADRTCSVVLIDLNDFKPLNDRLGHAAGDAALVLLAALLRKCVREGDVVARLGGDEFSILLPDATQERAQAVATDIRNRIAATPLALHGETVALSASIGAATEAEARAAGRDVVAMADERLYKDKARQKRARRSLPDRGFHVVSSS